MSGERRSYVIFRRDGLLLHTRPITERETRWLFWDAYNDIRDQEARARYLSEWGNVMDASDYVERLRQLGVGFYYTLGVYDDPEELVKNVTTLLDDPELPPGARQAVKKFLSRAEKFLRRPVEPKPIDAPVRYLELPHPHIRLNLDGTLREVDPGPEWYAHEESCRSSDLCRGVSVFKESFWLWFQGYLYTYAVAVRRDVSDGDVIAALANDDIVQAFLRWRANDFREVLRENEAELVDRGYEDVVRKAKAMLMTYELLTMNRREEEALPA